MEKYTKLIIAAVVVYTIILSLVSYKLGKSNCQVITVPDTTKIIIYKYQQQIDSLNTIKNYEIKQLDNMSDSDAIKKFYELLSD